MLRKIVSYLICLSLILQTFPVHGTKLTTLCSENGWDGQIEDRGVRCLTVRKAKSNKIRLAFDRSLQREGEDFLLMLDENPVGRVFYRRGQLNFWGYAGNSFSLESPDTYVHPLFCAQTEGDLCLVGGQFSKESVFISENLTTSGKYTGVGSLLFQARQDLSFQGDYTVSQFALRAKNLNLNATGTANAIEVQAESINEARTNQLFAEKKMVFSGYTRGFTHRGTLKSKNDVIFTGGSYTGDSGSQTLAGCLLHNKSDSINEAGRLAAGLGHFQSPKLAFKDLFDFSGDYFIAEGTGDLTTSPQSCISVYYGAKLGTTGKLNHQGAINQGRVLFPSLELFGLGTSPPLPNRTPEEQFVVRRQKMREIEGLQLTRLPRINLDGIALEGAQGLLVKDAALLYTPTDNIELKSAKKLISKGTVQSGFSEGVKTIVKAESAILEGAIRGNGLLVLIDHYLNVNGAIEPKLTQVVFSKAVETQKKHVVQKKVATAQVQKPVVQPQLKPVVQPQPKPGVQPQPKPGVQPQPKPVVQATVLKPVIQHTAQKPVVPPQPKPVVQPVVQKPVTTAPVRPVVQKTVITTPTQPTAQKTATTAPVQPTTQSVVHKATTTPTQSPVQKLVITTAPKTQPKPVVQPQPKPVVQPQPKPVAQPQTKSGVQPTVLKPVTSAPAITNKPGAQPVQKPVPNTQTKPLAQKPVPNTQTKPTAQKPITTAPIKPTAQKKPSTPSPAKTIAGPKQGAKQPAALKKVPEQKKKQEQKTFVMGPKGQISGALEIHNGGMTRLDGGVIKGRLYADSQHFIQGPRNTIQSDQDAFISGKTARFGGKTQVKNRGVPTTEKIDFEKTATLKAVPSGTEGGLVNLDTKKLNIAGDLKGSELQAQAKTGTIAPMAKIEMAKSSTMKIDACLHAGETTAPLITMISQKSFETTPTSSLKAKDTFVKAPSQTHGGKMEGDTAVLLAQKMALLPSSTIKEKDSLHMEARQEFNNQGKLSAKQVYADIPDLRKIGDVQSESLVVKAQQHQDPNDITSGRCPKLTKNNTSIHLITPQTIDFIEPVNVPNSLGFTSPSITTHTDFNSQNNLTLCGTQNLDIKGNVSAKGVASIQGPTIHVKERKRWEAHDLSVKATNGSILNSGTMHGYRFLERTAAGDIVDDAISEGTDIPQFTPAQAIGGVGIDYQDGKGHTRKLGLKDVAGGNVKNNASYKTAHGDIFQEGRQGIKHQALSAPYISHQSTRRSGFLKHKKKTVTIWSTIVANSRIHSTNGRLISHAPKGGLDYIGAHAVGRDGDIAVVRDQIRYDYLMANESCEVRKSSGWGISKSRRSETHQVPVITKIINKSTVDHTSLLKGIHGTGVSIQTPHYRAKAKGKIVFDDIQSKHSISQKHRSLTPNFFGSRVLKGESVGRAIVQSDPLGNRIEGLVNSRGAANKFAQAVQTGIQAYQDATTLSEACLQGNVPEALLERYGNVGLTASRSSTTHDYTTSTPSTFDVGILDLESETGVELIGGTQADIQNLLKVRTPTLTLGKTTCESKTTSHSSSLGSGINVATGLPNLGGGSHSSHSHTTAHQNARIQIHGPNRLADLGKIKTVNLDGGNIIASRITGDIENLKLTSHQDTHSSSSRGGNINISGSAAQGMTGSVNVSKGHAHEKKVNQHSSLIATNGFDDGLKIGHLTVTDTVLDPNLANHANSTTFIELKDVSKSHHTSIGLSTINLNSPEGFVKSMAKSTAVMGTGYVASKVARTLGANDLITSMVGTTATMVTSAAINNITALQEPDTPTSPIPGYNPTQPGLNNIGEFSESRNGKETRIVGVDVNLDKMGRDLGNITQATNKLSSDIKSVFSPHITPSPLDGQRDELGASNPYDLVRQKMLEEGATEEQAEEVINNPQFQKLAAKSQDIDGEIFVSNNKQLRITVPKRKNQVLHKDNVLDEKNGETSDRRHGKQDKSSIPSTLVPLFSEGQSPETQWLKKPLPPVTQRVKQRSSAFQEANEERGRTSDRSIGKRSKSNSPPPLRTLFREGEGLTQWLGKTLIPITDSISQELDQC